MDMEHIFGRMVHVIKGILRTISFTERELMNGLIKDNMLGIGKIIKWMEMEYLYGLMVGSMKEIIRKIKKKGLKKKNKVI